MEREEPTFQRVGRYELIRKIATGGMAELFLARFSGPGGFEKRCAVKRILPQFAEDAEFTRMFLNEARVAAMFDHPNIAQTFELGVDEQTGQLFIAMELINGMDLRQLLRLARDLGKDVPPELAAYLMAQALDGLAYAHEFRDPNGVQLRVVHRDVSPQNILVSFDGALKLVDFGIVKLNSAEGHTQSGMIKGKVAYMAPEQAAGEPLDGRADVFAIGVCLYELITGVKPFRGATEVMTLKAILEQEPQPITALAPECPDGIEAAIHRALKKAPGDRFQSAREFQLALLTVLRECPVPLDRHLVSQFVKSLTESDTTAFEPTSLKIPRTNTGSGSARFAGTGADEAWRSEAKEAFKSALEPREPKSRPPSVFKPVEEASPMAQSVAQNTDSGVFPRAAAEARVDDDVARLAGLSRPSPTLIAGLAAAAALGAILLLWSTREAPVVVEASAEPPAASASAAPSPPPREPPPPSTPAPTAAAIASPEPTPTASPTPSSSPTSAPVASASPERERERDRRPRPRPELPAGRLTLATQPRGLTVKLGDKTLGTTPLEGVPVAPGRHTFTLSSSKLAIHREVVIEVGRDQPTSKTIAIPRGIVTVKSRPYAEVFIDGQSVGVTPVTRPVYVGKHQVRLVSSEGKEEQTRLVEVVEDKEEIILVKF